MPFDLALRSPNPPVERSGSSLGAPPAEDWSQWIFGILCAFNIVEDDDKNRGFVDRDGVENEVMCIEDVRS